MAKKESTYAEGPAGYNGGNGPGNAKSLPIKNYPGSKLPAGKIDIEGPCKGKEGYDRK
jgi:hypothetical protein